MSIYYNFDVESKKYQVKQFPLDELINYENGLCKKNYFWGRKDCLIMLGIYSLRTAHLLNYIFNIMRDDAEKWLKCYGGGIIIDSGTKVVIGKLNEIGLHMDIKYNKCEKLTNAIIFKSTIFKKIRSHIKSFIEIMLENKKSIRKVKDNDYLIGTVTLEELKLLMDFFGYKELQRKYSKDLIEKMIGKKSNDQFLISAVDVFMNEINDLINEKTIKINEIDDEFKKLRDELHNKFKKLMDEIENEYQLKIQNIQDQISQMSMHSLAI